MVSQQPVGALVVRRGADGQPFYEAKWRRAGRQVKRRVGPAWLDAAGAGGWRPRRGRIPSGWFDEKRATVRMAQLIAEHDDAESAVEERERERKQRGVTVRELASEWLSYLESEKGAKPSTLLDYRYQLMEPGTPHKHGRGRNPGRIMAAFGDVRLRSVTTRQVAAFLRGLDRARMSPRSVNKHRQVLAAMFSYACREDTYGLAANPVSPTSKRREMPPAVLDFFEPEEIEALARAAESGAHREPRPYDLEAGELEWRAWEDHQDAELYRVAAYTGMRLGELLALRWEDVDLDRRRVIVHRAVSAGVEGPTKSWQARALPLPTRPRPRSRDSRPAGTTPAATATCSARGWGDAWTPQPRAAATSAPATPPHCGPCASTAYATPPGRSSRARPARTSSRRSSGTPD